MLTASNDCSVALWDINKTTEGRAAGLCAIRPHTNGLFTLHEVHGRVLTGSKDGSCAVTQLTPTGLSVVQTFTEAHSQVVKCARW